jgi:chemotaxis signal transduction protein
MSAPVLSVPRLVLRDTARLERRAFELAAGGARTEEEALLQIVTFRLGGARCAVAAEVVERAVARLAAAIPVPLANGAERCVTFVDERPLPLVDLSGHAAGAPRAARQLVGQPALVVATAAGAVAVVVDGPLELAEETLAGVAAGEPSNGAIQIAGRLTGGAALVDPAWLAGWAGEAGRS